jgi:hypothetical protein
VNRRRFVQTTLASALAKTLRAADAGRPPRILLRSSWQVVNIGDIAHTPGVLALLEKHLPEAEVRLWASADLSAEVAAMQHRRFPHLRIVKGSIGADGKASSAELGEGLGWCDFLLHGSGPSLVAAGDVAAFVKHVGKPFGVYGITHGSFLSGDDRDLLGRARFVFFRDSVSLARAKADGVRCPVMEFGPDGAFACDLRNDGAAEAFLRRHRLATGEFLCCIPRLRYTPYWLIHPGRARDEKRAARNDEMADHDHAPLRDAIAAVVRETGLKVLLCPEDRSQMEVGRRFVCRFAEQTSKGFMWRDIGLGDWLFDFDQEADLRRLVPAVLALAGDPAAARDRVARAQAIVRRRQVATMAVVRRSLPI